MIDNSGYLLYNPVNDMYLTIDYLGARRDLWTFAWVERPGITTWISFKGEEADRLIDFISKDSYSKHGMFVPFKFERIRERVNTILVDHILSVPFAVADFDDIGGLYL